MSYKFGKEGRKDKTASHGLGPVPERASAALAWVMMMMRVRKQVDHVAIRKRSFSLLTSIFILVETKTLLLSDAAQVTWIISGTPKTSAKRFMLADVCV